MEKNLQMEKPEKDIKYKRNFLSKVIFRIDFSPILKISEKAPTEFQNEIKNKFPFSDKEDLLECTTKIVKVPESTLQKSIHETESIT